MEVNRMPKKRKCRFTQEELNVHEMAVKLRKMTDQQLVNAFNEARNAPQMPSEVQDGSAGTKSTNNVGDVRRLLNALSEGRCKGIAKGTVYKLTEFAEEMGLI